MRAVPAAPIRPNRPPLTLGLAAALLAAGLAGCVTAPTTGGPGGAGASAFAPDCTLNADVTLWPDPCTVLASPNESPAKTEIDLAVNPKDPLNVIVGSKDLDRTASECVWSVLQVTKDGGKTWKTVYVGGDSANRHPMLAPFACVTDPMMVFDADGVAYYALQAYRAGAGPENVPNVPVLGQPVAGSTFILARSTDGGETWDHYALQHAGDGVVQFHDYPRMLVSPTTGAIHTIWNGVGQAGVTPWVSSSRDGGETVDRPVTFSFDDAPMGTGFFSGFAAAADGTIYVTAQKLSQNSDAGEDTDVWIWKSTDDARSFQLVGKAFTIKPTPRQLDEKYNKFRTPSFVEMAIDASSGPHKDRIHLFWPDYGAGNSDVLSSFSDDGGVTWSAPVNVATDATNDQFFMRPTVGPDGTVHVLFSSRAFDPANKLLDQIHAWSADGGETWQNRRLTASGFDGDKGVHQNGFPFIGDYNDIQVGPDGVVWAAWGDTRLDVAEIAVARILRGA